MRIVRNKAFTLIELLLVIAVMSILAAVGVMVYRQSFEANRVDTLSIEMQHVLEAAMAFYVDQGKWPDAQVCDDRVQTNNLFVTNYLPNGNAKSPLGNHYCWGSPSKSPQLFWVAIEIPNANDSLAMAARIAGHLPNALTTSAPNQPDNTSTPPACTASACFVRAEVTVPGASSNVSSGVLVAATGNCHMNQTIGNTGGGQCADNSSAGSQTYQISFNACPAGTTPVMTITPNFVTLPQAGQGYFPAGYSAQSTGCSNTPGGQGLCTASVVIMMCSNAHNNCTPADIKNTSAFPPKYNNPAAGASYIISCQKNNVE